MKRNIFLSIVIALLLSIQQLSAQKFVLPIFPDTQEEVAQRVAMLDSQISWLVANKQSLNIPIVLHVGDIVNFDNYDHWEKASKAFDVLDAHNIPYALAVGNHDAAVVGKYHRGIAEGNANKNLRITEKFNAYFPVARFTHQRGRYEVGKSDNAYYTFRIGQTNWLVITLEFCPRRGALNWAGDILAQYDSYNAILLTHYYLDPSGEVSKYNGGFGDFSPSTMQQELALQYPNIKLVLSGHVCKSATRIDTGKNGNKVYQILQDYQDEDFGGGYLRLLAIDLDAKNIEGVMYSPFYKKYREDSSRFVMKNVDFLVADDFYPKEKSKK